MAITDIYPSAIREYEYSPGNGTHHSPLNIAGDVWAVACAGPDRDAWLYTVRITSAGSTIGTVEAIGSLELEDDITCYSTKLKRITGNYYLVAYIDDAGNTVRCVTVEISPDGTIVGIIDGPKTLISGVSQHLDIERRSSGVYVLAYSSTGFNNLLATFNISDAGAITTVPLGTAIMAAAASAGYWIYHLPTVGNFLIGYQAAGLRLSTYTVDAAGNIGAEIANLVLAGGIVEPEIVDVAGINYAVVIQGPGSDGWLYTFECTNAGLLGAAAIRSFEFDGVYANHPTICKIGGINFVIAWRDNDWDGQVATIDIDATGIIGTALLDQEEYESGQARGPRIVLISAAATGLLAIFNNDAGNDGWIHTIGIGDWAPSVVTTQAVSNILPTTATGNGDVTDLGAPGPFQHGHCWSTAPNPTIADDKTELGAVAATGAFTSPITGLVLGTLYYVRAYVTTMLGTVYGVEVTFTATAITTPTVTTNPATAVEEETAIGNGNITDNGGEDCDKRGFVYNTSSHGDPGDTAPADSEYSNYVEETDSFGTGAFTGALTSLEPKTTYYVRAYAHNSAGYSYGDEVEFTTLVAIPTVTTQEMTDVEPTTAMGNGNVTDLGGENLSQHGHCWSTSHDPTTSDDKTELGAKSETGAFTSSLTGLSPNTVYYCRAYAINSAGTSYGSEVSFTTPVGLPSLTTEAASAIGLNGATLNGALTSDGGEPCYCGFEWGETIAYGTTTPTQRKVTGEVFSQPLLHLGEAAQYHFRAFATNSSGTAYGEDRTIDTLFRTNKAYALARYEV